MSFAGHQKDENPHGTNTSHQNRQISSDPTAQPTLRQAQNEKDFSFKIQYTSGSPHINNHPYDFDYASKPCSLV